jgi:hypothetical protein
MSLFSNNLTEPFRCNDVRYSRMQAAEADEIRKMSDNDPDKEFCIKCFEVETGKKFPPHRCLEFGINTYTALLDSRVIERSCAFIANNPREARKYTPL